MYRTSQNKRHVILININHNTYYFMKYNGLFITSGLIYNLFARGLYWIKNLFLFSVLIFPFDENVLVSLLTSWTFKYLYWWSSQTFMLSSKLVLWVSVTGRFSSMCYNTLSCYYIKKEKNRKKHTIKRGCKLVCDWNGVPSNFHFYSLGVISQKGKFLYRNVRHSPCYLPFRSKKLSSRSIKSGVSLSLELSPRCVTECSPFAGRTQPLPSDLYFTSISPFFFPLSPFSYRPPHKHS